MNRQHCTQHETFTMRSSQNTHCFYPDKHTGVRLYVSSLSLSQPMMVLGFVLLYRCRMESIEKTNERLWAVIDRSEGKWRIRGVVKGGRLLLPRAVLAKVGLISVSLLALDCAPLASISRYVCGYLSWSAGKEEASCVLKCVRDRQQSTAAIHLPVSLRRTKTLQADKVQVVPACVRQTIFS